MSSSDAETLANWLNESHSTVGFTGAGISTESGIPDFRSPGGIWSKTQPVYYSDFLESAEARFEHWRQKSIAYRDFADAKPNIAHEAFASWESEGIMRGVITQNIDGLHHIAGSKNVLEIHGTARYILCLDCGERYDTEPMVEEFKKTEIVPECEKCGGLLKTATISFGQSLVPEVLQESSRWAREADLFLAMGSSLVVEPAASLPATAKQNGARLVIINRDSTPLDYAADLVIHAGIGETIQQVQQALAALQAK